MSGGISTRVVSRPAGWVRVLRGRRAIALLHPAEFAAIGLQGESAGAELTPELQAVIDAAQRRSDVRRAAGRVLSRRAIAARALREKLMAARHAADDVDAVIGALVAAGALNDAALAEAAAARAIAKKGSAALARSSIEARGIEPGLASRAVERARADRRASDLDLARELARSRLRPSLRAIPVGVQRRRIAGVLARRGHTEETIEQVLDEVLGPARGRGSDIESDER